MSELVYGKNSVREILKSERKVLKLYLVKEDREIESLAKAKKIAIEYSLKEEISRKIKGNHQGYLAIVEEYQYYDLSIVDSFNSKIPFVVILDSITDPHNLGAIIRTAEAAKVDAVIIPKNRSAEVNSTVTKTSTGATEHVRIIRVNNLNQTIKVLKEKGYWIVGAENTDKSILYTELKYDFPVALVIGSEGKGISQLVAKNCDYLIKIPMKGKINSLNASVSAGILIYEIIRNR
ncbi:MAG TPA: 23S rRNA (guanosine(2251)-2'-O)-methyltransferase RlmB [Bacilli bacterium]|nr:23S rRNA (guanosine(2251)-2'-O)-methyltransferase RlmB [Bacilli bacterium]